MQVLVLVDIALKPFIVIVKNNNQAKHMFARHINSTISSTVALSKPKLESYYEKEIVLSVECIFLVNKNIDLVKELSSNAITEDRKFSCFQFWTSKFCIQEFYYSDSARKGSCDRYYLGKYFC